MKKVLLVLGFAVCVSGAFAQTANNARKTLQFDPSQKVSISAAAQEDIDYKSSIFTKDDEVLATFEFGGTAGVTIGKVTAAEASANPDLGSPDDLSSVASSWMRIPNLATIAQFGQQNTPYSSFVNAPRYGASADRLGLYMGSENDIETDNGFMFLNEFDAAPLIGGVHSEVLNSYFALQSFDVTGATMVDIRFRQYYRKFYEHTYIDYKINGVWHPFEVNVAGIDVRVNGTGSGLVVVNLPREVAQSGTVEVRFRAYSKSSHQIMGYMWAVDNVQIVKIDTPTRWRFNSEGYLDGFYGTIPQDFKLPMAYTVYARNTGINNISGVTLDMTARYDETNTGSGWVENDDFVETFAQTGGHSDNLVASTIPQGSTTADYLLTINERGFMVEGHGFSPRPSPTYTYTSGEAMEESLVQSIADYWQNYMADNPDSLRNVAHWGLRSLPTAIEGRNQFILSANSTSGLSTVLDTMTYTVSGYKEVNAANGITVPGYRWGHDNGVIATGSEFAYQFEDGYVSVDGEDNETPHQYEQGYEVFTCFNTPAEVPVDEDGNPWVIRGVELIPSSIHSAQDLEGVRINVAAYVGLPDDDGVGMYYYENYTGLDRNASITVHGASAQDATGFMYQDEDYHAVNIALPGQPVLWPNTQVYFGYRLPAGGTFSLGTQQRYYSEEGDSTVSFYDVPELYDYANQFYPSDKYYDAYAVDGVGQSNSGNSGISGRNINVYPMIRLIVGPAMPMNETHVNFNCDSIGDYWIYRGGNRCETGEPDTMAEGSTYGYTIYPGAAAEDDSTYDFLTEGMMLYGGDSAMVIDEIVVTHNGVDRVIPLPAETNAEVEVIEYNAVDPNHSWWEPLLVRKAYKVYLEDMHGEYSIRAKASLRHLGIEGAMENHVKLALAPNPANSSVRISLAGVTGKVSCDILDMSGRVIYNSSFNAENEQVISLNGVAAGAYFVRVTGDTFSKVERLIVR